MSLFSSHVKVNIQVERSKSVKVGVGAHCTCAEAHAVLGRGRVTLLDVVQDGMEEREVSG